VAHTIIINGEAVRPPHGGDGLAAQHTEGESPTVKYSVTYAPPHDLSLDEQIKRTGKIQRLCAKIEAVALGGDD
jgi:hypothetical protein